mmetsp:Transcript_7306/g.14477  ORF Transcript_7306/g.14477 Transcript_7306/m.14477 type:complete len:185 (+) Transcript_7306:226-780(+)
MQNNLIGKRLVYEVHLVSMYCCSCTLSCSLHLRFPFPFIHCSLLFGYQQHGRVAMLAVVGFLTTYAGVRFPGAGDIPAGMAAWSALPLQVWVQMGFTWSLMEMLNRDAFGLAEFPGDYRNGSKCNLDGTEKPFLDFGWDKQSEDWKKNKRAIELNNGRAAQMGILGLMVHEQLGNLDAILPFAK